jgi:hypothetical protein
MLYFSRKPYDIYIWRQINGVGMDRKVGDYLLVLNWMWGELFKWTEKWWEQASGSWKSWDWDGRWDARFHILQAIKKIRNIKTSHLASNHTFIPLNVLIHWTLSASMLKIKFLNFAKKREVGQNIPWTPDSYVPEKIYVTPTTKRFSVWYKTSCVPVRWCSLIINKKIFMKSLKKYLV